MKLLVYKQCISLFYYLSKYHQSLARIINQELENIKYLCELYFALRYNGIFKKWFTRC